MKLLRSISAIILFFVPFHSMAWGVLGHRITGEIAEKYLTAKAKREIRNILGNESIAMAANWADFVKSDSAYGYLFSWHYINLPAGISAARFNSYLKNDTAADLYTKLNFIVSQLKNKALPKEKKVFYLKLLIHLSGDANQPMHTGHGDDRGGNNIKLLWFNTPTNLHRVWDENLIDFQQLSYTEYAAAINHATPGQIRKWQKQPIGDWLYDSYVTCEKLYTEIHPDEKLSYPYNYYHIGSLNEQLLKGGIRLAGLLNQVFA